MIRHNEAFQKITKHPDSQGFVIVEHEKQPVFERTVSAAVEQKLSLGTSLEPGCEGT